MSIPWVELEKLAQNSELNWTLFIKAYEMLLDVFELDAIKNEKCYKLKPVL